MSTPRHRNTLSGRHKAALAEGREQGRTVRRYLDALARRQRPGPPRTPEGMRRRITEIDRQLPAAEPLRRLQLVQERLDLERDLAERAREVDLDTLEAAFVEVAAAYSRRKGISYAAWREVGVPAAVLRRAGVRRGKAGD